MRKALSLLVLMFAAITLWAAEGAATYSGTVPVIFINTDNGEAVSSKTEYLNAKAYILSNGYHGLDNLGSQEQMVNLQIRGRGNYTWNSFDKKPYRLKFEKKQEVLGMATNKHFALLAHADDDLAFLRNTVGFEISRRMNMPFTPSQVPVEVVLNGEYIGLYMLTETIRIDKSRIDIEPQADNETDPELIQGGWLVEIDNYGDESQIQFNVDDLPLNTFYITHKTPEILSESQYSYLYDVFSTFLSDVYTSDKSQALWKNYIDMESLARYYIVMEATDHYEAFLGSCYMYKKSANDGWTFGTVWDFGHAFDRNPNGNDGKYKLGNYIYNDIPMPESIIKEIMRFPEFKQMVKTIWQQESENIYSGLNAFIDTFIGDITVAAANDAVRWPEYGTGDTQQRAQIVKDRLKYKRQFLNSKWNGSTQIVSVSDDGYEPYIYNKVWYDLQGRRVSPPLKPGIYVVDGKKMMVR